MTIEHIAQICHEANRVYCQSTGDYSQLHWEQAPEWQKESMIAGVKFVIDQLAAGNTFIPASATHDSWLAHKAADGWVYGPVKDTEAKTHPCMVPFDQLPLEQRLKDTLFISIITGICNNNVYSIPYNYNLNPQIV